VGDEAGRRASSALRADRGGLGTKLDRQTSIVVLVSDGVARAKVRLRAGRFVTVPVHNNVYSYAVHGRSPGNLGTTWLDAAGHRIDHRNQP
jgi:hypothetical protein